MYWDEELVGALRGLHTGLQGAGSGEGARAHALSLVFISVHLSV